MCDSTQNFNPLCTTTHVLDSTGVYFPGNRALWNKLSNNNVKKKEGRTNTQWILMPREQCELVIEYRIQS